MADTVAVLVGTRKGAFVFTSSGGRTRWQARGPYFSGHEVYHIGFDQRDGKSLYAAVNSSWWGPHLHASRDLGRSWRLSERGLQFSPRSGRKLKHIWHLEPGADDEPGVIYAGVEPAALFRSEDRGRTWRELRALAEHPTRDRWHPGAGGLCLHSVQPVAGGRIYAAISAAGVFRSDDRGRSWRPINRGVRADFLPKKFPEVGQCPHKLLRHPSSPDLLYQRNHCGMYRSDDGGKTWKDISKGLPSRFGFPMALDPAEPKTVWVLPEDSAEFRGTSAGPAVYRSRNGGSTWQKLTRGLPGKGAYLHFFREGMAADGLRPCGVYFGTSSGSVFYSRDAGERWQTLANHLPAVLSVSCAVA